MAWVSMCAANAAQREVIATPADANTIKVVSCKRLQLMAITQTVWRLPHYWIVCTGPPEDIVLLETKDSFAEALAAAAIHSKEMGIDQERWRMLSEGDALSWLHAEYKRCLTLGTEHNNPQWAENALNCLQIARAWLETEPSTSTINLLRVAYDEHC